MCAHGGCDFASLHYGLLHRKNILVVEREMLAKEKNTLSCWIQQKTIENPLCNARKTIQSLIRKKGNCLSQKIIYWLVPQMNQLMVHIEGTFAFHLGSQGKWEEVRSVCKEEGTIMRKISRCRWCPALLSLLGRKFVEFPKENIVSQYDRSFLWRQLKDRKNYRGN